MSYPDFVLERQAYRVAGHLVVAAQLGISVHSASIVFIGEQSPGVRLAKLPEDCCLDSPAILMPRRALDRAAVRIAGPIAEMIYTADRYREAGYPVNWPRWRQSWKKKLARFDDVDIDYAFACVFAWSAWQTWDECEQRFDEIWSTVESLLRERHQCKKMEHLATSLLDLDVLTGEEAMNVIAAS